MLAPPFQCSSIFLVKMESTSTWLKSVFQETGRDYPDPNRVKFSDLSQELHSQFPNNTFRNNEVSRIIREAFPHTESKVCGKSRRKHILGPVPVVVSK